MKILNTFEFGVSVRAVICEGIDITKFVPEI